MAKETGLGWTTLSVDDEGGVARDIRNDLTNLDYAMPMNMQEVTGIDKFAIERLPLLQDFSGTLSSVFNPTANRVHDVFNGNLRVVRTMTIVISAQTLPNEVLFSDYAITRAAGGELTAQHPFVLADGTVPTWS